MASHLDVAERLEYIQYSFNSMISQSRKPDSIWLSVSCLPSFVPQVRLMLQYFERVATSHDIDIYIFLQRERLMQFEHYHHIWKEFNQNKVRYPNCYITFSDDDDINGPDKLKTFEESAYNAYNPTFVRMQSFYDFSFQTIRPARTWEEIVGAEPTYPKLEYTCMISSLFVVNQFFKTLYPKTIVSAKGVTDIIFLATTSNYNTRVILPTIHYAIRKTSMQRNYDK